MVLRWGVLNLRIVVQEIRVGQLGYLSLSGNLAAPLRLDTSCQDDGTPKGQWDLIQL
jgi:hypothetical protein